MAKLKEQRYKRDFMNSGLINANWTKLELISKGVEIDDAGIEKGVTFQ